MKELSLNILDIAQNSVTARSTLIRIDLVETDDTLTITVSDNGCGMSKEMVENVTSPFTTSRTTRKVGLGIPLFKMAAEQTGGHLTITSKSEKDYPDDHGTVTSALFYKNHLQGLFLLNQIHQLYEVIILFFQYVLKIEVLNLHLHLHLQLFQEYLL